MNAENRQKDEGYTDVKKSRNCVSFIVFIVLTIAALRAAGTATAAGGAAFLFGLHHMDKHNDQDCENDKGDHDGGKIGMQPGKHRPFTPLQGYYMTWNAYFASVSRAFTGRNSM